MRAFVCSTALVAFLLLAHNTNACPYVGQANVGSDNVGSEEATNPHVARHRRRRLTNKNMRGQSTRGGGRKVREGSSSPRRQLQMMMMMNGTPPPAPTPEPTPAPVTAAPVTPAPVTVDNSEVVALLAGAKQRIVDLIANRPPIAAKFVRLGFHDCVGGCDGCVDLENPENFGLDIPINALRNIGQSFPDISTADLYVLAALTAAEVSTVGATNQFDFPMTHFGRVTCADGVGPDHRMPSAHLDTQGVVDFFSTEFGFDPEETVAILGAHTLGRLDPNNSGFAGPAGWVPNQNLLDNQFYEFLVDGDDVASAAPLPIYTMQLQDNSASDIFDDQYLWLNVGPGGPPPPPGRRQLQAGPPPLVMLNADMALVSNFSEYIANDGTGFVFCDPVQVPNSMTPECPHAFTLTQAAEYKHDNLLWLNDFRSAFDKMLAHGYVEIAGSCAQNICELEQETGFWV